MAVADAIARLQLIVDSEDASDELRSFAQEAKTELEQAATGADDFGSSVSGAGDEVEGASDQVKGLVDQFGELAVKGAIAIGAVGALKGGLQEIARELTSAGEQLGASDAQLEDYTEQWESLTSVLGFIRFPVALVNQFTEQLVEGESVLQSYITGVFGWRAAIDQGEAAQAKLNEQLKKNEERLAKLREKQEDVAEVQEEVAETAEEAAEAEEKLAEASDKSTKSHEKQAKALSEFLGELEDVSKAVKEQAGEVQEALREAYAPPEIQESQAFQQQAKSVSELREELRTLKTQQSISIEDFAKIDQIQGKINEALDEQVERYEEVGPAAEDAAQRQSDASAQVTALISQAEQAVARLNTEFSNPAGVDLLQGLVTETKQWRDIVGDAGVDFESFGTRFQEILGLIAEGAGDSFGSFGDDAQDAQKKAGDLRDAVAEIADESERIAEGGERLGKSFDEALGPRRLEESRKKLVEIDEISARLVSKWAQMGALAEQFRGTL